MSEPVLDVRVVQLPVLIWQEASSHADGLQREFDLIRSSDSADDGDVPARLLALIEDLHAKFGGVTERPTTELAQAAEQNLESIDLIYHVPVEAGDAAEQLGDLLDEADDYCRSGQLLTLVTPDRALRFRRWFLGEFARQSRGLEPVPWPAFATSSADSPKNQRRSTAATSSSIATSEDDVVRLVIENDGRHAKVSLLGDIDLQSAERVRESLQRIAGSAVRSVEVDLSHVTFIDSVGLSVLMVTRARSVELGQDFALRAPEGLRRTFALAGLDRFVLFESTDEPGR